MDEEQFTRTKKATKALKARVDAIERHLEPLLKKDLVDTYNTLPINEKCQLDMVLAYAINTLYYMYIRTQGQNPQQHDIYTELKRVQQYIAKIKEAEGRGPKQTLKLDKEAAGRFVKAALNSKVNKDQSTTSTGKRRAQDEKSKSETIEVDSDSSEDNEPKKAKQWKEDVKGQAPSKKKARIDPFRD
ncbi:uncharacterized protein BX664DRAFT_332403 [Halteromyces radiatus]|uniref:uncharacterized protein n=1 Tax=Halteromyces radiatus TaxID=101107 RepID=UPI002220D47F|nr:uncharacterized protein BX664DRAFT_332403 [Halteromyces radiatus]KAI8089199.1 hypothetical protein BX664DRAFT_332403 [Halteromyces radiatus]